MTNPINGDELLYKSIKNELFKNDAINSVVNSTISEWDIKGAHLTAIGVIFGAKSKEYNSLKELDKKNRNIKIGLMIKKDPNLMKKIQNLLYKFKIMFIEKNGIILSNIIETTKDSLVLVQKIPTETTFIMNECEIEFRNKEGFYSSFYRIGNKHIFFDSMTGNIRIKGISDTLVTSSVFVNDYLKPLLISLESSVSIGVNESMKLLRNKRYEYIDSDNVDIYRSLNEQNKFVYKIGDELVTMDEYLDDDRAELFKVLNYKDFVMPLMRTLI